MEIMDRKGKKRRAKRIYSPTKLRVLLLLQAGITLSFAGTIGRQVQVIKEAAQEWKEIDRQYLYRIVREFYEDRLVSEEDNGDGTKTIVLTEKGKKRAFAFNFSKIKIKMPRFWDGLWHIVIFDIPEKYKIARFALREKLLDLGFLQYQKSVYFHPYPCRDEVDFIIEFFRVRRYVRYGILTHIANEEELLLAFNLKRPA
ncbi:MAG: hypothetical protein Greene041679_256 [Parcubacteria group bacterium Greene0416_79]|nr:MAG: hypothetical protein Greene041679_256 [Parcubacteria group bacterium Greene0416_79]